MFRKLRSALLRGMIVVLPIGLTLWLLWWFGSTTESLLRAVMLIVIPVEYYRTGMGIAAGTASAAVSEAGVIIGVARYGRGGRPGRRRGS